MKESGQQGGQSNEINLLTGTVASLICWKSVWPLGQMISPTSWLRETALARLKAGLAETTDARSAKSRKMVARMENMVKRRSVAEELANVLLMGAEAGDSCDDQAI